MSMYAQFKTDEKLEQEGVWFEPSEDFRILVARAGGANKQFQKTFETLARPVRRAMELGTLSDKRAGALMHEAYAKAIVLDWQVKKNGEWVSGIEGPDGDILPVSVENIIMTFEKLPAVFDGVLDFSRTLRLYLEDAREVEAGN